MHIWNYFSGKLLPSCTGRAVFSDDSDSENENKDVDQKKIEEAKTNNTTFLQMISLALDKDKQLYSCTEFVQLGIALKNVVDPKDTIIETIFNELDSKKENKVHKETLKKVIRRGLFGNKVMLKEIEQLSTKSKKVWLFFFTKLNLSV